MKKLYLVVLVMLFFKTSYAQNYPNILNYNYNGTPTNGVKIKTNIPYTSAAQMPTISIDGYNYGTGQVIALKLVYYIYDSEFINYQITSSGTYNPAVSLSNEGGKVIIYINDKSYYQRFTVSAYAQGMSEISTWFTGWTTADEALTGTHTVVLPYTTMLAGNVYMPGTGVWNTSGDVGIGTSNLAGYKLAVNGNIRAKEVKVETGWSDYVFYPTYKLRPLSAVATYIKANQHLPDVPSAAEVKKNGINVGETNALLLKKIEELTLYLIEQNKKIESQQKEIEDLKRKID